MREPITPDGMLEVRCCCVPEKLLGYLPNQLGDWGVFPLKGVADWVPSERLSLWDSDKQIRIPIARFRPHPTRGSPDRYAYKAEGITLDELKKVVGFVPLRIRVDSVSTKRSRRD